MVLPVIEKQLIVWQQPTPCTFARCCRGWLLWVRIAHCIVSRVFSPNLDPSSGMRPTGGFCATMAMVMTNGIPWLIALRLFAWNSWRTANGALTFFQYISSLLSPAARWGSLEFNLWRSSFFFSSSFFFLSTYSYSTYLSSAIRFLCFAAGVLLLLLLWRWVSLVECHIASSECHGGHRDPIYIWRAQGDVEGWARSPNRKCCLLGRLDSSHIASSGCNGERLDRNICQTGCQNRMPYGMSDRMWNKMAEYRSNKLSDRLPEEKLNREAARLKLSRMSSKYEAHVFFHMLVKLKYDIWVWNMLGEICFWKSVQIQHGSEWDVAVTVLVCDVSQKCTFYEHAGFSTVAYVGAQLQSLHVTIASIARHWEVLVVASWWECHLLMCWWWVSSQNIVLHEHCFAAT
jgi:hypothetical protein